jgi:hypothetical protein
MCLCQKSRYSNRFFREYMSIVIMVDILIPGARILSKVRQFRFFFLFVISYPEAKQGSFRLVFASFREKKKIKFRMFSLHTFLRFASFRFLFFCFASVYLIKLKGIVARDFLPYFFFLKRRHMDPCVIS